MKKINALRHTPSLKPHQYSLSTIIRSGIKMSSRSSTGGISWGFIEGPLSNRALFSDPRGFGFYETTAHTAPVFVLDEFTLHTGSHPLLVYFQGNPFAA